MSILYKSLYDFISTLEMQKQLVRVTVPVSPVLEMTEIQTRLLAETGPAVLFENVVRADGVRYVFPVLTNLFGTVERVALGIGRTRSQLREIGETLALLKHPEPPTTAHATLRYLPLLKSILSMKPRVIMYGPCQEVVLTGTEVNLCDLPIQSCWPEEPGPLITWGMVVTQGPEPLSNRSDTTNVGIYRMQVISHDTTLMRWLRHRGGAQHFQRWQQQCPGKPFPTAVIIGADPSLLLAAVTPIPDTLSEYQFAGLLRERKVDLVTCITIPLQVPADSEIVLEGHVIPGEVGVEGPYGDHTGYYNSVELFPIFRISAITYRRNAVYLSTFTGRPPDEPSILGEALNEIFIPILVRQFPEIIDFWLPPEGCSYRIAVVSIHKAYPGHAKRVMMGIWSFLSQFMYTKFIIIVDDDINIRNWKDVMWAIATRMDPIRDLTLIDRTAIDYLDFASPEIGLGGKLGLDATNKWPSETSRIWGKKICMDESVVEKVTRNWISYGLPGTGKPIWS